LAGIVRDCKVCKEPFTTTSLKSAAWEMKCIKCDNVKRRTHVERNISNKFNSAVDSIEIRLEKIEQALETIPMIVGAEVSNALSEFTRADILRSIKKELFDAFDKEQDKKMRALKRFEEKLQQQIVTLNNKIIYIMKEMD
tara:strand:- start:1760 stop:2179 length:420 start_codon:yes stop_codon:yes gene_type:complete